MTADLLERARSASSLEEECDVIDDGLQVLSRGKLNEIHALYDLIDNVRVGRLPRPVLLGVVAALVPEGMGWGVNGPFLHADGGTHWEASCGPLDEIAGPIPALALLIAILEATHE